MPAYLTWLAVYVWLPLAVLWATHGSLVIRHKKTLAISALLSMAIGVPWDFFALATNTWSFPVHSVVGIYIFTLPIEEYCFMIFLGMLVTTMVLIIRARFGRFLMPKKVRR